MATNPFGPKRKNELVFAQEIEAALKQRIAALIGPAIDPYEVAASLPHVGATPEFLRLAERIASRMVNRQRAENARSWREAAARSTNGRRIFESLRLELAGEKGVRIAAIVQANANLIKSIPRDLAASATRYIAQEQMAGRRAEQIMRDLRKRIPELTKSKARLIAGTEVGKAESAMTQVRSEAIGANWYLWRTSEDAFVRPAHRLFDGVLVAWSDAPAPEKMEGLRSTLGYYHAGCAPNCRCVSIPLVTLDQVNWPCRVYRANTIVRMSRTQFAKVGARIAA